MQEFESYTLAWPDILDASEDSTFSLLQSEKNVHLRIAFQFQRALCRDVASGLADVSNLPAKQEAGIKSKDLGESIASESTTQSALNAPGAFARTVFADSLVGHNCSLSVAQTWGTDTLRPLPSAFSLPLFNLMITAI
jgi:hypothetical protein